MYHTLPCTCTCRRITFESAWSSQYREFCVPGLLRRKLARLVPYAKRCRIGHGIAKRPRNPRRQLSTTTCTIYAVCRGKIPLNIMSEFAEQLINGAVQTCRGCRLRFGGKKKSDNILEGTCTSLYTGAMQPSSDLSRLGKAGEPAWRAK
ncbi:hypothetical protein M426DRAFT_127925 [Hypoxylon sp. CI-4A]|nr:hypothetical protein M426DRAFT_127925 [Hypoxylon sp. CI-4A]